MHATVCPLKLRKSEVLIDHLLEKKKLLQKNDQAHRKYKTALIVEGGIFLGVYSAGVLMALSELGLTETFDYVIGVSVGTLTAAYFLSKQSALGASIFYEEAASRKFFNPLHFANMLDLDYLMNIGTTTKPLNVQMIRNSRSDFLIAVTNTKTGKGELLDAKDKSIDSITALKASILLPGFYNSEVIIKGKSYCDGAYGFPYPLEYAIRELHCTDVLVITNRNCNCQTETPMPNIVEKLTANIFLRKYSQELRDAFINRQKHYEHDMGFLWNKEETQNVNLGLVCRNKLPIKRFTLNPKKLQKVTKDAKEQTIKLFS